MKRSAGAMLLGIALLAGCGGGGKGRPAPAPAPAAPASEPAIGNRADDTPVAPGDDAGYGGDGYGAGAAGGSTDAVIACDGYIALVERYLACPEVDQTSRDATRQAIDAMKAAWADMGALPLDAQRAAANACNQASDAMRQGAAAQGCPL